MKKTDWWVWVAAVLFVGQLVMSWGMVIRTELKLERFEKALTQHAQVISQMLQERKK